MVAWTRRRKVLLALAMLVLLLVGFVFYAFSNLNPILISMAEAQARQLAVEAINTAIHEIMTDSVTYSDLMNVITDQQGNVSMIQANTLLMNDLATQAALTAQRNLEQLEAQGIELPLGSALGIGLFAGSGPTVRVSIVPVGSVTTRFVTAFESAGINQTRHEISLEASTLINIVIPTGASDVSVTNYVPVAESIIVGQVPDSFVNVPDLNGMLNMIP